MGGPVKPLDEIDRLGATAYGRPTGGRNLVALLGHRAGDGSRSSRTWRRRALSKSHARPVVFPAEDESGRTIRGPWQINARPEPRSLGPPT